MPRDSGPIDLEPISAFFCRGENQVREEIGALFLTFVDRELY